MELYKKVIIGVILCLVVPVVVVKQTTVNASQVQPWVDVINTVHTVESSSPLVIARLTQLYINIHEHGSLIGRSGIERQAYALIVVIDAKIDCLELMKTFPITDILRDLPEVEDLMRLPRSQKNDHIFYKLYLDLIKKTETVEELLLLKRELQLIIDPESPGSWGE